ncbi:GH1 family beta-glucosidase [Catellatospora bangladeshensis]|uniref:Beta-glucosidase n=1 Tax=Catellatospora bangladeshensis TaxID=310355 RepID=A0A8J3JW81_9ACTN|nr:GH1 family beta-glucosidase [Catellatospora bangladeshensis]GIF86178.1 beta-glucosidase [Catellatospora bangladeshensis]
MTSVLPQEVAAPSRLTFPPGFRWGAATASYQIEGAAAEDGRTPSIWDTMSRQPGRVFRNHSGDVACDHYHRYRDDVRLMSELGLGTYRFSVAWPRIKPDGSGPVNPRGLDFYDRLVDELLAAGIAPMVTLYHWDLPQVLEDQGGWTARDTAYYLGDLAAATIARLGDRVATWTTLNEPWCSAFLGYASGDHAPGRREPQAAYLAAHHLLLGHGLAAQALRAGGAREVSITHVLTRVSPQNPHDAHDRDAARLVDGLQNRIWLDPVLRGQYPADVLPLFERFGALDAIRDGDLDVIATPIDLLGVNYYQPALVRAKVGAVGQASYPGSEGVDFPPQGLPVTGMDWPIDATGLSDVLVRLSRDYPGTPLMVTENGSAYHDLLEGDRVADPERIAYFAGHLRAVHHAVERGADVRGYLAWSLMDNFEWAYGYGKRFGLVYVDYDTQRRVLKDSARWYAQVIRDNGL